MQWVDDVAERQVCSAEVKEWAILSFRYHDNDFKVAGSVILP